MCGNLAYEKMEEKRTYNFRLLVRIITTPFPTLSCAARHILGLLGLLHEKKRENSHSISYPPYFVLSEKISFQVQRHTGFIAEKTETCRVQILNFVILQVLVQIF
jgi:hypothetical protein